MSIKDMSDEKMLSLFFTWRFSDGHKMTEQEFMDTEQSLKKYNLKIDDLDIDEHIISQYKAFKNKHTKDKIIENKHTKDKATKTSPVINKSDNNTVPYIIIWIIIVLLFIVYIFMK